MSHVFPIPFKLLYVSNTIQHDLSRESAKYPGLDLYMIKDRLQPDTFLAPHGADLCKFPKLKVTFP